MKKHFECQCYKNYKFQCKKIPSQLCGPGACPIIAGPKECRKEMKTIVQEVPKERCSLRAQPFCEFETKLVPV